MTYLFLMATLALGTLAQEPDEPPPSPVEKLREMQQGEQDEIAKLFAEVEQRLNAVDRMLYDASAGRPIEGVEESGIDRLLRRSREASQAAVEGIDKILEIAMQRAQQQQQQQGGGGGGDQQQGSGSPLDQQRQGAPDERERTPEGQATEREDQQQRNQTQGDEQPENPQEAGGDPRNRSGDAPPRGGTARTEPGEGSDRWGDLPVHVRELFRVQGGDDLPPRYRDWIDAYYRRLNERP